MRSSTASADGATMKPNQPAPPSPARNSALAMTPETFRELGHQLIDVLADALAAVPKGRIAPDDRPSERREALGLTGPLPEHGLDPRQFLDDATRQLFAHSLFNGHPRFFGYITSSPAPIGMFGDLVAAALNPNVGSWRLSPAATEVELQTVRWIAELIGYTTGCGGLLVSGGNMANIACFLAARAAKSPWNVRAAGMSGGNGRQLIVYASAETHTWIQKATDLSGLGTNAIRWIPVDNEQRMDVPALEAQIAADRRNGDVPFVVVGTAGSVSTGAVDPLTDIARVCRDEDLWFHIDGAYGGFAAASPAAPDELRALALADSVAVDPHKWLYAPLEAGCALVRDPAHLRNAFSYHPPYYRFDDEVTNFVDFGPQNSRGFRALKVWLSLRQAGRRGYEQMISDDIRLSRLMASAIAAHAELELVTQALSIATFRYVPTRFRGSLGDSTTENELNALNQALLDALQREGELFVSNAVVSGRYVLRACIVNFHTQEADALAVPDIVARVGRRIDQQR